MKTAFITGSTKGIGKQIGLDLLDNGYYVYFNGHSQDSTRDLEKELLDSKSEIIVNEGESSE